MERKFTDNEIVKALECCCKDNYEGDCQNCPLQLNGGCNVILAEHALDLINRQKAEIDEKSNRLREVLSIVAELKTEAIKEFAERLKQHCAPGGDFGDPCGVLTVTDRWIDQLVKEMTGENNGN